MTEPYQRESELERSRRVDLDFPQSSMLPETEAERAARQPLFNKRRMFVWAAATLAIWMSVSYLIPLAFRSAREAIKESLVEASRPGINPEVRTIDLPNGKRITITTKRDANGHGSTTISAESERPEQPERPEPPERAEPAERPEPPTPTAPAASGAQTIKIKSVPAPPTKK